ncbi:MAG: hypothetical protein IJM24_07720 [Clostridia bacterium]|nr:hypothetical protein [Clostridia bacterium]
MRLNERLRTVHQAAAIATSAAALPISKKGEKSLIFEKTAPSPSLFQPNKALAEPFFDLQITSKLLIAAQTVSFETQFASFEA